MSKINDQEMKALCIAGEMSNKELAEYFGVTTTEVYAWRSNHNLAIPKCAAIRAGEVKTGKRTPEEIAEEILKVEKAKKDAEKKVRRAADRLKVLNKEFREAKS